MTDVREEFNKIRKQYQSTHTPQCRKCYLFHPWGNSVMEVHHKIMIVDGGTNDPENLVVLCKNCHEEYHAHCESEPFDLWVKKPPLWAYAAMGMLEDKTMKDEALTSLDEWWPYIADARMTSNPWQYRKYVKENSVNWVDW